MKTAILFTVVLMLSVGMASSAVAQDSDVAHDTWSSGTPMPRAIMASAAAVLGKRIIVVGGVTPAGTSIADTYIYSPDANTWSKGVPLPTPTSRPRAITCCRFASLKTLLMPTEATTTHVGINVPGSYSRWPVLK